MTTIKDARHRLYDRRVKEIKPLIPPQLLLEDIPLTLRAADTVLNARSQTEAILRADDDRLMVVVGYAVQHLSRYMTRRTDTEIVAIPNSPCSVHDVQAGLEYAKLLQGYAETAKEDLFIIMRVYFEKPRTTVGWKGLINDPLMNSSFKINQGLRTARKFLLDVNSLGLPAACEFLDTISPQYLADLVAWGAIGARTTESQVHRELASAMSMPIGFKNGTDGGIDIALDACNAARSGHVFLSVGQTGLSSIVETEGNPDTHIILRGGKMGPNYTEEHVKASREKLKKAGLPERLMIDCSHGNSQKIHSNQPKVAEDIARQLEQAENAAAIMGVMLESNLVEGRQNIPLSGPSGLKYGQSVTDACISWVDTVPVLDRLREGVRARRAAVAKRRAPLFSTAAVAAGSTNE